MSSYGHFVIRVYGLGIYDDHLLVVDEFWFDTFMTKFPGGGLEYGEGTIDCLKRECMEEFGQEVKVLEHFYTTDFFQETRFLPGKQLISIYYVMEIKSPQKIKVSSKKFDFEKKEGSMSFRWLPLDHLSPNELTLPIDKLVTEKLLIWQKKKQ
ncbi:MAG: NUDIX domain-containing protein [Bacteroides sp.]|jgi:ADP-ribose pyrophosphatase YjhB (NUDIX family)|nr:NUDIX domain-containing protein [Bacteroides sp.]